MKAHTNTCIDIHIKFPTHDTERGSETNRPVDKPVVHTGLLKQCKYSPNVTVLMSLKLCNDYNQGAITKE